MIYIYIIYIYNIYICINITMTSPHNLLITLWAPKDFKNRGWVHLPHKASCGLFTFFRGALAGAKDGLTGAPGQKLCLWGRQRQGHLKQISRPPPVGIAGGWPTRPSRSQREITSPTGPLRFSSMKCTPSWRVNQALNEPQGGSWACWESGTGTEAVWGRQALVMAVDFGRAGESAGKMRDRVEGGWLQSTDKASTTSLTCTGRGLRWVHGLVDGSRTGFNVMIEIGNDHNRLIFRH